MKTEEGNYVMCIFTGKICYTEREAGLVINGCKRHVYVGNGRFAKSAHGNSKAIPRRKYYCKDCGFYHLTHLALYDFDSQNYAWEDAFYREFENKKKARMGA
jgi:hypothetical protein